MTKYIIIPFDDNKRSFWLVKTDSTTEIDGHGEFMSWYESDYIKNVTVVANLCNEGGVPVPILLKEPIVMTEEIPIMSRYAIENIHTKSLKVAYRKYCKYVRKNYLRYYRKDNMEKSPRCIHLTIPRGVNLRIVDNEEEYFQRSLKSYE